jgi:hypothetical protein
MTSGGLQSVSDILPAVPALPTKSPRTVDTYGEAVDQLSEWLADHHDAPATTGELNRARIEAFLIHLFDVGRSAVTLNEQQTEASYIHVSADAGAADEQCWPLATGSAVDSSSPRPSDSRSTAARQGPVLQQALTTQSRLGVPLSIETNHLGGCSRSPDRV